MAFSTYITLNSPTWSWCKISRMQIRRSSLLCVTNQVRAVSGRSVHICSQYTTWHLSLKELRLMFPGRVAPETKAAGQSCGISNINKKAKLDEENLAAQARDWKYQCKECLKSNQNTFIIKCTKPSNGPNGPRDTSCLCLSQCRRSKDQTKFIKSQYKFVQTIN